MHWRVNHLDGGQPVALTSILGEINGRSQRVLTFLALLEVTRLGMTVLEQDAHLGPIAVAALVSAQEADLRGLPKEEVG